MQQPVHAIRAVSAHRTRRDLTIIAAVGLLHITAISALYLGLFPNVTHVFTPPITLTPIKAQPPETRVELPPPSAVKMIDVQPQADIPPVHFDIKNAITPPPNTVTPQTSTGVSDTHPIAPPTVPATVPISIAATHTTPDYPAMSRRLNEEGTVRLRLSIDADGSVSDAVVESSSGFARLDAAAIAWVKAHWRYHPATRDGKPAPSFLQTAVKFTLNKG